MPLKPLKPCSYPGCTMLTSTARCARHPIVRNKAIHRLYDRNWSARRRAHLERHPFCEDCAEKGVVTMGVDVHHEIPHRGNADVFRKSPLRTLCKACHARRTRQEMAAGGAL